MITNVHTINYPNLFRPKETQSGELKYSCSLLIDKTDKEGVAMIKAEIDRAIEKGKELYWKGRVPKFRTEPLRDGDEELETGGRVGSEYKGRYFLNCSAKEDYPPGIVGRDGKLLKDQSAIYSGCQVRLDIGAVPFQVVGSNGISWRLYNVMLVGDGKRLDGRMDAVDAFAAYAVDETSGDDDDLA